MCRLQSHLGELLTSACEWCKGRCKQAQGWRPWIAQGRGKKPLPYPAPAGYGGGGPEGHVANPPENLNTSETSSVTGAG